jgi:hypothetical protein
MICDYLDIGNRMFLRAGWVLIPIDSIQSIELGSAGAIIKTADMSYSWGKKESQDLIELFDLYIDNDSKE